MILGMAKYFFNFVKQFRIYITSNELRFYRMYTNRVGKIEGFFKKTDYFLSGRIIGIIIISGNKFDFRELRILLLKRDGVLSLIFINRFLNKPNFIVFGDYVMPNIKNKADFNEKLNLFYSYLKKDCNQPGALSVEIYKIIYDKYISIEGDYSKCNEVLKSLQASKDYIVNPYDA